MIGKGSVNHNRRTFIAENVDAKRTNRNIEYCYSPIQNVYHEMFDDALQRYNEKQTRSDRRIENYYKKIRSGKQEKPFHEIIIQVGSCDDMSATGENSELAKKILEEYYADFQRRNPYLKVFSAHLHMDEGTPHLHIDFVPFTSGSKRGLDTRVSLKQALANQGFIGKGKRETEWSLWVLSEKEQLANVMKIHGIEWLQKGTHDEHLSVLDFKKQERAKEVALLNAELESKKDELEVLNTHIQKLGKGVRNIEKLKHDVETGEKFHLPEPTGMMSAKKYKKDFVEPLISRLKSVIKAVFRQYYEALNSFHKLNQANEKLSRENERLQKDKENLIAENEDLRSESKDFRLLRKVFGSSQIDNLIVQAKKHTKQKSVQKRPQNIQNER